MLSLLLHCFKRFKVHFSPTASSLISRDDFILILSIGFILIRDSFFFFLAVLDFVILYNHGEEDAC